MHHIEFKNWLKLALLVALVAAAVYFFGFTQWGRQITPELVLNSIESHGRVTARLVYVAVYIVGTVGFRLSPPAFLPRAVLRGAPPVFSLTLSIFERTIMTTTIYKQELPQNVRRQAAPAPPRLR